MSEQRFYNPDIEEKAKMAFEADCAERTAQGHAFMFMWWDLNESTREVYRTQAANPGTLRTPVYLLATPLAADNDSRGILFTYLPGIIDGSIHLP